MVKNRIKVYARLKKELKNTKLRNYDIVRQKDAELLVFYQNNSVKKPAHKFRFDKVFNTTTDQSEIFENIAKPVLNGVLNGYNGTIFAYGPTGTGKTYSLTGSHTKYKNRGLIPRTIEYVFNFLTKSLDNYSIHISYLEIYNEIAYDLLNPKENVSTLEELPRVILLEDNKGEAHFKNLSIRHVSSEEEAMRLLFLGDTNRTIAETPLNEYSSRSHCVFIVHVSSRTRDSGKMRRSKLNLVDLAGSERIHRMSLNGVTLNEAKYINLSLHYLEQVILALSESRRAHIPYRNSIMTFMLRDSISGNCLTAMLATLSVKRINYQETLTTCKFSQRVSMVKTNAVMNEETDPHQEIAFLRNEVLDLRKKLSDKTLDEGKNLTAEEILECKISIKNFIEGSATLCLNDIKKTQMYVRLLREEILKKGSNLLTSGVEQKYKELIKQKDEEISLLMNIFENKIEEEKLSVPDGDTVLDSKNMFTINEKVAFQEFLYKYGSKFGIQFYTQKLNEKHKYALDVSNQLAQVQTKIRKIRENIDYNCKDFHTLERFTYSLKSEQNIYRELLLKLQNIKNEIEYLEHGMAQAKIKIMDAFKKWLLQKKNNTSQLSHNCIPSVTNLGDHCQETIASTEQNENVPRANQTNISEPFNIHAELDVLLNVDHNARNNTYQETYDNYNNFNTLPFNPNTPIFSTNNLNNYQNYNTSQSKISINSYPTSKNQNALESNIVSTSTIPDSSDQSMHQFSSENSYSSTIHSIKTVTPKYGSNMNVIPCLERAVDEQCSSYSRSDEESVITKSQFSSKFPADTSITKFLRADDRKIFIEFMRTVPLTGEDDVDEEIIKFYRMKFNK